MKCRGSGRKNWEECVNDDMKLLGLVTFPHIKIDIFMF